MGSTLIYNGVEFADDGSGILAPAVRVTDAITDNDQLTTKLYTDTAIATAIASVTPSGPAGGSLSGTYPNPGLATQAANTVLANATVSTAPPAAVDVANGLNFTGGKLSIAQIVANSVLANLNGSSATPSGVPIGTGLSFLAGQLIATGIKNVVLRVLTSGTTYTPTTGTQYVIAIATAGGADSGTVTSAGGTEFAAAGGGASGGTSIARLTAAQLIAPVPMQIGGANTDTFLGSGGSLLRAVAGSVGQNMIGVSGLTPTVVNGGFSSSIGAVGDVVFPGNDGGPGIVYNSSLIVPGYGAASFWGGFQTGSINSNSNGKPGVTYGSGGTGGVRITAGSSSEGSGSPGILLIFEFIG